jgi:hypothetical protein
MRSNFREQLVTLIGVILICVAAFLVFHSVGKGQEPPAAVNIKQTTSGDNTAIVALAAEAPAALSDQDKIEHLKLMVQLKDAASRTAAAQQAMKAAQERLQAVLGLLQAQQQGAAAEQERQTVMADYRKMVEKFRKKYGVPPGSQLDDAGEWRYPEKPAGKEAEE